MHDLRQIIEEAKPTVLQLFGVAEAIETHLERSVRESGQAIDWQMTDESGGALRDLDPTVSVALFRIAQEAINNAIRHGQSDRIMVRLGQADHALFIEVEDDGRGIGAGNDGWSGHGIDNMKTRARLISARFEIGQRPFRAASGRGTRVRVVLPINLTAPMESL
jgi:signal transduction histidine kinase